MPSEIDLFGVIVSPFLVMVILTIPLHSLLKSLLSRKKIYQKVWHPPLFDIALYVILLCSLAYIERLLPSG
jgi:hypothetical protein